MAQACEPLSCLPPWWFTGTYFMQRAYQRFLNGVRGVRIFALAVACHLCFLISPQSVAQNRLEYRFEEGEPLAYQLRMTIQSETVFATSLVQRSDRSTAKEEVGFTMDYQLMPIALAEDGCWKIRLVLDQVSQTTDRDGEVKKNVFDRSDLRRHQISSSEVLRVKINPLGYLKSQPEEATATGDKNSTAPPPASDDLFDRPILVWISSQGALQRFEDRTELQQVMPGVNLQKCIELALPTLAPDGTQEGSTWEKEIPVDLPATPLERPSLSPMILKCVFTALKIEKVNGKRCARISLNGHFVRDGLSIPIRKEVIKYLVWTTSVTRIDDEIHGTFFFDLDEKRLRSSELSSTYSFSTVAGRKEDDLRGQIRTENRIRMTLVNQIAPTPATPTATSDRIGARSTLLIE